jgi:hypothetical protein
MNLDFAARADVNVCSAKEFRRKVIVNFPVTESSLFSDPLIQIWPLGWVLAITSGFETTLELPKTIKKIAKLDLQLARPPKRRGDFTPGLSLSNT